MHLVDRAAGQAGHERVVADLVAKPGHHRGDLGIEQRRGHRAEPLDENLHILARGVEHFGHRRIGQQFAQWREVEPVGDGIDDRDLGLTGELDEAQLGIIRALAHELGIDGDELFAREPLAERGREHRCR